MVAACVHLGKLTPDQTPTGKELMNLPYLDKTTPDDFGTIRHMGTDRDGNEVYVLGTKNANSGNLLQGLADLQQIAEQFVFLGTMPFVNNPLRLGGWLSRAASLPALGRPLVIKGLQQSYPKICSFVEETRVNLGGSCH